MLNKADAKQKKLSISLTNLFIWYRTVPKRAPVNPNHKNTVADLKNELYVDSLLTVLLAVEITILD